MYVPIGRPIARFTQLGLRSGNAGRTFVTVPSSYSRVAPVAGPLNRRSRGGYVIFRASFTSTSFRSDNAKPASRPKAHTGTQPAAKKRSSSTPRSKSTTSTTKPKSKGRKAKKPTTARRGAKRARKTLSPEEKTQQQRRQKLKQLKLAALSPPKPGATSAWAVFFAESAKNRPGSIVGGEMAREASSRYKALSPEDLEHYNHLANQNKQAAERAYASFITSHTPGQIYDANLARKQLKRLSKANGKGGRTWPLLKDERQPKGRLSSYGVWLMERQTSGDYKGMDVPTRAGLISKEWKELSAEQKRPYETRAAADKERYRQEFTSVLGKEVRERK